MLRHLKKLATKQGLKIGTQRVHVASPTQSN